MLNYLNLALFYNSITWTKSEKQTVFELMEWESTQKYEVVGS